MSNRNSSDEGNESDDSASSTTMYGSEPPSPTPSSTGTVNDSTPSLSLAEQDRLYGTIVVPQSLPEPWFPDGNLHKIMWDLPCKYQGSIWPHYCKHYKAFHYVMCIQKYVKKLKALLTWTLVCLYCGSLMVSRRVKEEDYTVHRLECQCRQVHDFYPYVLEAY
ncbi:hypothetical protein EV421DRAFT_1914721 [Armillaria borealis]|uniref:Uncharacterized protein n=1 Tax=Armillaria borealis TaxID=47425 RepID=A0AA39IE39_9AGAR|nr:hypothetical protein EV421DRAFT_1914721 [Armillaria borealis]